MDALVPLPVPAAAAMLKRMDFKRVALAGLAALLAAATQLQPEVQPGSDIPPQSFPLPLAFPPVAAPDFAASTYERRAVFIPMRDGVRLHAVLVVPKAPGKHPIMLDRTPYSADKRTSLGPPGSSPETILSPLDAELVRAGYILAVEDVRGKFGSEGDYVM